MKGLAMLMLSLVVFLVVLLVAVAGAAIAEYRESQLRSAQRMDKLRGEIANEQVNRSLK